MSLGRAVRNLRPASLILYGTIGALVLLIACFPLLFPHGIRIGGPASLEGLLVVGDGDWTHASFEPRALLEKNERLRPQGMQEVGHLCLDASAVRPQLERALGAARRDRFGGRGVWLQAVATRHFGAIDCIARRDGRRGVQYGSIYRVTAVREVRPRACGAMTFTLNNRRCPTPPPSPGPRVIDAAGSYHAEALRRGTEGRVWVEALIGPKEKLLACKPVVSSGDAALDRAACAVFAGSITTFAGKGSTEGLAAGVRRIRVPIRFEIDRSPPAAPPIAPLPLAGGVGGGPDMREAREPLP